MQSVPKTRCLQAPLPSEYGAPCAQVQLSRGVYLSLSRPLCFPVVDHQNRNSRRNRLLNDGPACVTSSALRDRSAVSAYCSQLCQSRLLQPTTIKNVYLQDIPPQAGMNTVFNDTAA